MNSSTGILLLHGLTGMPAEMKPVEKYFRKQGFITEAPLLAGHGGTQDELLSVYWPQWVESAQAGLDKLLKQVDRVIVVGLSMGGTIGATLAQRNPQVKGVVILSPTLIYDGSNLNNSRRKRMYKTPLYQVLFKYVCLAFPIIGKKLYWVEKHPYGLKDERLQRQIAKAIESAKGGQAADFGIFRTYYYSLLQMHLLTQDFRKDAASMTCPVLLMHSYEDTIATICNAAVMYDVLESAPRKLHLLTGCDHVLTLDLQRNYICKLIGDFVHSLGAVQLEPTTKEIKGGLAISFSSAPVDESGDSSSQHNLHVMHDDEIQASAVISVVKEATKRVSALDAILAPVSSKGSGKRLYVRSSEAALLEDIEELGPQASAMVREFLTTMAEACGGLDAIYDEHAMADAMSNNLHVRQGSLQ